MIIHKSCSYPGDREINEDSCGTVEKNQNYLFILADGLGGHGKGDEASRTVVSTAKTLFLEDDDFTLPDCFQRCQDSLMAEQKKQNITDEMKTTLVLLQIIGNKAISGHVGDSRLYFFRKNKLVYHSLDHSVPQMLVARGEIKEKDIRGHDDRNRLLRVLGTEWSSPRYELHPIINLKPKDCFLLCSDGYWELIEEKIMMKTLKASETPEQWLDEMNEIVKLNGKGKHMDNYTAVTVWVK